VNQDIPVAAVQIRSDSQSSEIELLEYCRSLLGIYSPKRIFILDKIPRNDRGKVNREEIKLAINKIRSSDNLP
jgi:acyl-CoA synthetase (AMP-forming)/AMP-acid ligase II